MLNLPSGVEVAVGVVVVGDVDGVEGVVPKIITFVESNHTRKICLSCVTETTACAHEAVQLLKLD